MYQKSANHQNLKTMRKIFSRREFIKTSAAVAGAGGLMCSTGCDKDISFAIPLWAMNALGAMSYSSTMQGYRISANQTQRSKVLNSGKRIEDATKQMMTEQGTRSKIQGFAWEYDLLDDPTVNAWCMPGARIAFYEGIMDVCHNEAGVAAVMGHEVAHAVYNHGGKRMAQQLVIKAGVTSLSVALDRLTDFDDEIKNIALSVFGVGGTLGALAYSRKHEFEADKTGMILMARAGYDPREAPMFWERMMHRYGSNKNDFMSTHPSNERRVKALKDALPEAMTHYNPYG